MATRQKSVTLAWCYGAYLTAVAWGCRIYNQCRLCRHHGQYHGRHWRCLMIGLVFVLPAQCRCHHAAARLPLPVNARPTGILDRSKMQNDKLGELAKNNQDYEIQNITLCNMYFSVYTMGSGQSTKKLESFWAFCVSVCKVTFNCKLQQKNGGAECIICSPIILLGE